MSAPRTYPPGVTSWVDLDVPDLDTARSFYGGLFGWELTVASPPGASPAYAIATLDGADVAGLAEVAADDEAGGPSAWSTYVAVRDADEAAERVRAAGGQVLSGPESAGPAGRSVVCRDPDGVAFRMWEAGRRLGAQLVNSPGSWNFSDLHAADPARSARFYSSVFGWVFDDLGFATMIRVPGYGEHLAATTDPDIAERQASVQAPPGFADAIGWAGPVADGETPHWHVSFTVADRDASTAAVQRLAGTVLDTLESQWTKDAVVRDPFGAVFTLSQFDPQGV